MIIQADTRNIPLADGSVQCVVTSPPYWGLRDYGTATWVGGDAECDHSRERNLSSSTLRSDGRAHKGLYLDEKALSITTPYRDICGKCGAQRIDSQIGLEPTPEAFVATMVEVFREVKRVLRDDGVLWLNLGDSYSGSGKGGQSEEKRSVNWQPTYIERRQPANGLKPKDLCGIPWRVAFALQADGWYLRSDIIWAKPNPMPESVTDRPTRSHEYLFLLAKSERYYFDQDSIREPEKESSIERAKHSWQGETVRNHPTGRGQWSSGGRVDGAPMYQSNPAGRNKRDVWTINSEPTPEAHFATFPQKLIEPCILAGTSEKGCCAECGAPRVRVTERETPPPQVFTNVRQDGGPLVNQGFSKDGAKRGSGQKYQNWLNEHPAQTVGWQPSCDHDAPSKPCLVLDIFLGSGTVGVVCERFGRRWVGTELSTEYIKIARKRTAQRGLFT